MSFRWLISHARTKEKSSRLSRHTAAKVEWTPVETNHFFLVQWKSKGGEIRDTKTLNLSRNIVSLQVLVDVSRFSPCLINLTRNKNICCGLKKWKALIG